MIRKTLTFLSLIGLLLSVGAWGVSCFGPAVRTRHSTFALVSGGFAVDRYASRSDPIERWYRLLSLKTRWRPGFYEPMKNVGYWSLFIPLWMPTALFGAYPLYVLTPIRRRRKRKRLGLCINCGYDLRASKDRCPECGEEFGSTNVER